MGTPTVIPMTSKQGWAMWPAQRDEANTFAVFDKFTEAGFTFCGELRISDAPYWIFKKPVQK